MDIQEAKAQLAYVTAVVERATQFTLISPLSGWSVGLCGLAAGGISQWWLRDSLAYTEHLDALAYVWSTCFVLSIALAIFWTRLRAKQENVPVWDHPVRQGLRHFLTLVAVGGILTAGCAHYHFYFLIPSIWMLCYGTGLIVSSMFSLKAFRPLGVWFLIAGSLALFWPIANQILLTFTFGVGHLALGTWIFFRFPRHPKEQR